MCALGTLIGVPHVPQGMKILPQGHENLYMRDINLYTSHTSST